MGLTMGTRNCIVLFSWLVRPNPYMSFGASSRMLQEYHLSLPYIAGFLDGEGGIAISGINRRISRLDTRDHRVDIDHIRWTRRVYITNTYLPILESIQAHFPKGRIRIGDRKENPRCKPCYILTYTSQEASAFLQALLPYLVVKRRQAELFLEFAATVGPVGHHHIGQQVIEHRYHIYTRLLNLNKKGVGELPPAKVKLPDRITAQKEEKYRCNRCRRYLPRDSFCPSTKVRRGFSTRCKECLKEILEQTSTRPEFLLLEHDGQLRSLPEWAAILDIPRNAMYLRLKNGWAMDRIIRTPLHPRKRLSQSIHPKTERTSRMCIPHT